MEKIIVSSLLLIAAGGLLTWLVRCSTVGKGKTSLIRAHSENEDLLRLFPQYVTSNKDERLIAVSKSASTDYGAYTNFLNDRYGSRAVIPVDLDITVRDRGKSPPFLPVDVKLPSKLYELYAGANGGGVHETIKLEQLLKARLYNVQDLIPRTTLHHLEGANEVFYFYPRISVDFSSQLRAQTIADRFSYLGVAVILKNQPQNNRGDAVRILDFWPKGADIVEYSRGNLKQEAQINAKGAGSASHDIVNASENSREGGKSTVSGTDKTSVGIDLSYVLTETYVNELKDAFEQRTAGVFDGGRVFLAGFRSIKNKRIGGTYNFDLMLEVPSELADGGLTSEPIIENVEASVHLIAVVRHVYDSGKTGIFHRVPEPDNDKAYEQVLIRQIGSLSLWRYGGKPYYGNVLEDNYEFDLKVNTNLDEARFVVRDIDTDKIVGSGHGKDSSVLLAVDESRAVNARVEFLDVIASSADGRHVTLKAGANVNFVIRPKEDGSFQAVGEYRLDK